MKKAFFLTAIYERQVYPLLYDRKSLSTGSSDRGSCLPCSEDCSPGDCDLKTSLLLCVNLIFV